MLKQFSISNVSKAFDTILYSLISRQNLRNRRNNNHSVTSFLRQSNSPQPSKSCWLLFTLNFHIRNDDCGKDYSIYSTCSHRLFILPLREQHRQGNLPLRIFLPSPRFFVQWILLSRHGIWSTRSTLSFCAIKQLFHSFILFRSKEDDLILQIPIIEFHVVRWGSLITFYEN